MKQFDLDKKIIHDRVQSRKPKTIQIIEISAESKKADMQTDATSKKRELHTTQELDSKDFSKKVELRPERKILEGSPGSGKLRKEFDVDEELRKLNMAFDIQLRDEKDEKKNPVNLGEQSKKEIGPKKN